MNDQCTSYAYTYYQDGNYYYYGPPMPRVSTGVPMPTSSVHDAKQALKQAKKAERKARKQAKQRAKAEARAKKARRVALATYHDIATNKKNKYGQWERLKAAKALREWGSEGSCL